MHAAVDDSAQLVVKYGSLSVENGRTLDPDIASEVRCTGRHR